MENNVTDSGGRVTRSLRKRLVSVDSDNSNRPDTPISSKLTPISEICASPSRLTRATRRNSTSGVATPVKTPAKRGLSTSITAENLDTNTPSKGRTRRRGASVNENDEPFRTCLKISTFTALDEEISPTVLKPTIVTRSKSKSPQQSNSLKKTHPKKMVNQIENNNKGMEDQNLNTETLKIRRPGPKSKTRVFGELDDMSDVEIDVLGSELEDLKNNSPNTTTVVLTDDDQSQMAHDIEEENKQDVKEEKEKLNMSDIQFEKNKHREQKHASTIDNEIFQEAIDNNSNKEENASMTSQSEELEDIEQNQHTHNHSTQKEINAEDQTDTKRKLECDINKSNISGDDHISLKDCLLPEPKENSFRADKFEIVSATSSKEIIPEDNGKSFLSENASISVSTITSDDHKLLLNKDCTIPESNVNEIVCKSPLKDCVTPEVKEVFQPVIENLSDGTTTFENCESVLKKVDFTYSPSTDMTAKVIYPKTPVSTKSTHSFKDILLPREGVSFEGKCNSLDINLYSHQNTNEDKVETNNDETESQIIDMKCTRTLEIDQSPINIEPSVQDDQFEVKEKATVETKEEPLGNKTSNKLDNSIHSDIILSNIISDEDNDHIGNQNENELKWINPSVKGVTIDGSKLDVVMTQYNTNAKDNVIEQNLSSEAEEMQEDEDSCDEEEGSYKRNHDFHDDEAMEVDDYESGDSMGSEERREIEENEIPVDGEHIGNQSTVVDDEDEYDEEKGSENDDSFIVSDTEELERHESDYEDGEIDDVISERCRKKDKKIYKRVQRLAESSSSDEDTENYGKSKDSLRYSDDDNNSEKEIQENLLHKNKELECDNEMSMTKKNNLLSESRENTILDSSKSENSVIQFHYSDKSESDENNTGKINNSCKEILCNLNQSHRFDKSIHRLNPEADASRIENSEASKIMQDKNDETLLNLENIISTSPNETTKKMLDSKTKQSETHFEVLVTSETDTDKENKHKYYLAHDRKDESVLSISFGNCKTLKSRKEWQRSFSIDVNVKHGLLETGVNEPSSTGVPSTDYQGHGLESDDIKYEESNMQMPLPLGNRLIRTKRQSLALPTNPDMEICSHNSGFAKNVNRKNLTVSSNIDFKPSQSFIDTEELQKNEEKQLVHKRKRLSKSFCGASENHDNSIVDIDVCHLHKRSKLACENSTDEGHDSIENYSSSKLFTKLSSTPHEKINKNVSYNSQRILARCEEILEAANRAKLEAKIRSAKSKSKISKKPSKKKYIPITSEEANPSNTLRRISKEIKRKDKAKTALSHAIMTADDLLTKRKKSQRNKNEEIKLETKQLPTYVLEAIGKSSPVKNTCKKEHVQKEENSKKIHTSSTSAGKFMELPQSPKMKKKSVYIQSATGKVTVEPITPKKRLVKAFNGMEFLESSVTPSAVGFKVKKIGLSENVSPSSVLGIGKRKRNGESIKHRNIVKGQWTQSGLFTEEEIPKNRGGDSKEKKKRQIDKKEHISFHNFKEMSVMRPDIKRSTKRDILLLRERRQIRDNIEYM